MIHQPLDILTAAESTKAHAASDLSNSYVLVLTFAARATSEGLSSLNGDGTPLDGLKNAGKSSVP